MEKKISKNVEELHESSIEGQLNVVTLLRQFKGLDVNARNNSNRTPLHMAAKYGHHVVVKHLIEDGAEVNATTEENWLSLIHI